MRLQAQQQQTAAGMPRPIQPQGSFGQQQAHPTSTAGASSDVDGLNVSDNELESLLSQQDIGSFAENLLKQFQEQIGDLGEENAVKNDPDAAKSGSNDVKPDTAALNSDKPKTELERAAELMDQMDIDHLDIPTTVDVVQVETYHPPEVSIKMTAEEMAEICSKSVPKNGRIPSSILSEDAAPPTPPERP